MFGQKRRELELMSRIKELENLLCPAEQHDYHMVDEVEHVMYAAGLAEIEYTRVYVCKKCFKRKTTSER